MAKTQRGSGRFSRLARGPAGDTPMSAPMSAQEMSLGVQSRDDTPGGREDERARAHYLCGEVLQRI